MKNRKRGKCRNVEVPKLITTIGVQHMVAAEDSIRRGWKAEAASESANPPNLAGGVEMARLLIEGARVDAGFPPPPHPTVHVQNGKGIRRLLGVGADPNVSYAGRKHADLPAGATPLMIASGYGRFEAVMRLLGAGADVHASDEHGHNALFWALRWDKADAARELLRRGSKITDDGLCGPVRNGNQVLVEHLISKGANPNAMFRRLDGDNLWPDGETLLGYAVTVAGILDYPEEIIELLVNAGADVNQPTEWFILCKDGAQGVREMGQVIPLEIARRRGMAEVMKLLRQAGRRARAV